MKDMDSNAPVTRTELREELAALESRMMSREAGLDERLTDKLTARMRQIETNLEERLTDNLTATMRQIETNMLTAFHSYARAQQTRQHTTEVVQEELRTRMAALEDRMLNLETHRPPSN